MIAHNQKKLEYKSTNPPKLPGHALRICPTGFKFSQSRIIVTILSRERKTQNHKLQLYLGQQQITRTDNPKILGLILDKKHIWSPFLQNLKTKCCRRMNILKVIAQKIGSRISSPNLQSFSTIEI